MKINLLKLTTGAEELIQDEKRHDERGGGGSGGRFPLPLARRPPTRLRLLLQQGQQGPRGATLCLNLSPNVATLRGFEFPPSGFQVTLALCPSRHGFGR